MLHGQVQYQDKAFLKLNIQISIFQNTGKCGFSLSQSHMLIINNQQLKYKYNLIWK